MHYIHYIDYLHTLHICKHAYMPAYTHSRLTCTATLPAHEYMCSHVHSKRRQAQLILCWSSWATWKLLRATLIGMGKLVISRMLIARQLSHQRLSPTSFAARHAAPYICIYIYYSTLHWMTRHYMMLHTYTHSYTFMCLHTEISACLHTSTHTHAYTLSQAHQLP